MKTGLLLVQVGTPDAPEPGPVRRYLKQFLSDRRVVDLKWFPWIPILQILLLFRPGRSAAKYRRIWDPITGSPLRHHTTNQREAMRTRFPDLIVDYGMQYGNPGVGAVVDRMIRQGVDRLIVMPMYPQYSMTTTAGATDALFRELFKQVRVPAIRIIPPYYDHPAYIGALTSIMQADLAKLSWTPEHYVISFHGIPVRYCQKLKDPYATHVKATTRSLTQKMGWKRSLWTQSFQSIFGREVWLKPNTDTILEDLAKKGVKKIYALTPGFTADCLETVDEIGHESLEAFQKAGGESLRLCPGLNDHPIWIDAMETIIRQEGLGWI